MAFRDETTGLQNYRRRRFLIIALLLWSTAAVAVAASPVERDSGPIRVALVQFAVTEEMYTDHGRFREQIATFVRDAATQHRADLVIFPEYVNVFALFDEWNAAIRSADGLAEVQEIAGLEAPIPEIIRTEAGEDTAVIRNIWSDLAREHGVWILAGTAFVRAGDGTMRNRAWLFAPDGSLEYRQDKVFLTDFEKRLLGLAPGEIERIEPFTINGVTFGLSICRDSYFEDFEARYSGVDVWLDIRANGERWTDEVRRRFDGALPERVANTPVERGLSTSLNGSFLDFVWQGPAFVVDDRGQRIWQSPVIDGSRIIVVSVP